MNGKELKEILKPFIIQIVDEELKLHYQNFRYQKIQLIR